MCTQTNARSVGPEPVSAGTCSLSNGTYAGGTPAAGGAPAAGGVPAVDVYRAQMQRRIKELEAELNGTQVQRAPSQRSLPSCLRAVSRGPTVGEAHAVQGIV